MKRPSIFMLSLFALFLFQIETPAHAYLDPGTGSIMLQALIGAIGGALVVGRLYWSKIKEFFAGTKGKPPSNEAPKESDS